MTARDRTVVMIVGLIALTGAFWFLVLGPKKDDLGAVKDKVSAAHTRLATANQAAAAAGSAKATYDKDYATVAKLGKAVPADDDVPALVFQLQTVSKKSGIAFDSIKLTAGASPVAAPAAATPSAQVAGLAQEQKGTTASPATTPSTGTTSTGATTAPAPATGAATGTGAAAAPSSPVVAAAQTAFAGLPPGAAVGAAGIPTMPFEFQFSGPFKRLEKLLRRIKQFTRLSGDKITVNGRLMTIDSITLSGFPKMQAVIKATAFVLPTEQGLTAGATPQAPAAATPAATTASTTAGSPAPPVAAATPALGVGR